MSEGLGDTGTSYQEPQAQSPDTETGDRYSVLEVFGLKLEVSNPRLAELLTMDAKQALGADVRDLVSAPASQGGAPAEESVPVGPAAAPLDGAEATAAVGDVVLASPTPRDEFDARLRREFKNRAFAAGSTIGFDTAQDGIWHSPTGLSILTRTIERGVSLAAASHYVSEIAARRESISGPDSTVLFVVDSQQTADVFKVAIRQRHLYDLMRTISIDNLEDIRGFVQQGAIDHQQATVLLVPIRNIDVGEVLSILRSTQLGESA